MAYEKFPMWTHKQGEKSRIVHTQEELDALGEGWSDAIHVPPKVYFDSDSFIEYPKWVGGVIVHSAEEEAALAPAEPELNDERAALIQIAEEKGVKIDKRWSNDKIRAALEAV
ncbi:hypothetical protein [Paraburkholderia azotifigens]|uniref:hypothetical protein n=1 Tax=Paraburkholderia azotifigens TaxID=2057004 RepID=UPI0038B92BAA